MSEVPTELRYSPTHEWVRVEDNQEVVVGITDYAQDALGDVVYVELPRVGNIVGSDDEVAVVESVKAASDIYVPLGGEIVRVNEALEEQPELLNIDPYGDGWIFTIVPADVDAVEELLDSSEYLEHCESQEHDT